MADTSTQPEEILLMARSLASESMATSKTLGLFQDYLSSVHLLMHTTVIEYHRIERASTQEESDRAQNSFNNFDLHMGAKRFLEQLNERYLVLLIFDEAYDLEQLVKDSIEIAYRILYAELRILRGILA
jgi:hypothetical protein